MESSFHVLSFIFLTLEVSSYKLVPPVQRNPLVDDAHSRTTIPIDDLYFTGVLEFRPSLEGFLKVLGVHVENRTVVLDRTCVTVFQRPFI